MSTLTHQLTYEHLTQIPPLAGLSQVAGKSILGAINLRDGALIIFTDASWIELGGHEGFYTRADYSDRIVNTNCRYTLIGRALSLLEADLIDRPTYEQLVSRQAELDQAAQQAQIERLRTELATLTGEVAQ